MPRPNQRIAGFGPARRVQIVHHRIDFLGQTQGFEFRQIENEFRRCFGTRHVLKLKGHAVEHEFLSGRRDEVGRGQKRYCAKRHALAQPAVNIAFDRGWQQIAEHISCAAPHRITGDDVLAGRFFNKTGRGHKAYFARRQIFFICQRTNAAKMVGMAVRRQNRLDRALAKMLVDDFHRGAHGFGGRERVDNNPACIALDKRHIGEVKPAYLIDAVSNLKQAVNGI